MEFGNKSCVVAYCSDDSVVLISPWVIGTYWSTRTNWSCSWNIQANWQSNQYVLHLSVPGKTTLRSGSRAKCSVFLLWCNDIQGHGSRLACPGSVLCPLLSLISPLANPCVHSLLAHHHPALSRSVSILPSLSHLTECCTFKLSDVLVNWT